MVSRLKVTFARSLLITFSFNQIPRYRVAVFWHIPCCALGSEN